jgi:hypothetical protein
LLGIALDVEIKERREEEYCVQSCSQRWKVISGVMVIVELVVRLVGIMPS